MNPENPVAPSHAIYQLQSSTSGPWNRLAAAWLIRILVGEDDSRRDLRAVGKTWEAKAWLQGRAAMMRGPTNVMRVGNACAACGASLVSGTVLRIASVSAISVG